MGMVEGKRRAVAEDNVGSMMRTAEGVAGATRLWAALHKKYTNFKTPEEAAILSDGEGTEFCVAPGRPYFLIRVALTGAGYDEGKWFGSVHRWMYGREYTRR